MKKLRFSPWGFVRNNFSRNARLYLLLTIIVLFGVVLGIVLTARGVTQVNIFEGEDSASIFDIVSGNTNPFALFFSYILRILLSMIILLFLTLVVYILPLSIIYIAYQGYILGVTISSLVILAGFSGAINTIFFLLPINLLSFTTLIIIEVAFINRLITKRQFRLNMFESYREISPSLLFGVVVMFVTAVLYSVVFPIVLKSMIFVSV